MLIRNLEAHNSIANQFLSELRSTTIQNDRLRFRLNLSRLGEIMAYEISKELNYKTTEIITSLGKKVTQTPSSEVVLITMLRAGLPFLEGFQRIFDNADTGFIGSYRVEGNSEIKISSDYYAAPPLTGKTVILLDPMLATGQSGVNALQALARRGQPKQIHFACVIAAPEGVDYLKKNIQQPASLWTFSIDEKLNSNFYIVPGLGDAGDLSFGQK